MMRKKRVIACLLLLAALLLSLPALTEAADTASASALKEGQIVTFGSYADQPLEWYVAWIDNDISCAILVNRYAVDVVQYHTDRQKVTWADCYLRTWLNTSFYDQAFTAEEQDGIITCDVEGSLDYVFILSKDELLRYKSNLGDTFQLKGMGVCYTANTQTGEKIYMAQNGSSSWWLRYPEVEGLFDVVPAHGESLIKVSNYADTKDNGVRPVIVVSLDAIQ